MLTELGEKSEPTKANNSTVAASILQPPKMTELLPCPRCASTSTKFCYYNNYNLSQPRHFCKSCRRYWTQGGTLRNVPVGGGTRKNSKRSRSSPKSVPFSTSSSSTVSVESEPAESVSMPIPASMNGLSIVPETNPETFSHYTNLNLNENENFTSLLNAQGAELLGGYGSGYVAGFEEMSFGLNRAGVWPIQGMGYVGVGGGPAAGASGCNTWQLSDVGGGLTDGDFLGWPGLSISMPGKGSK